MKNLEHDVRKKIELVLEETKRFEIDGEYTKEHLEIEIKSKIEKIKKKERERAEEEEAIARNNVFLEELKARDAFFSSYIEQTESEIGNEGDKLKRLEKEIDNLELKNLNID